MKKKRLRNAYYKEPKVQGYKKGLRNEMIQAFSNLLSFSKQGSPSTPESKDVDDMRRVRKKKNKKTLFGLPKLSDLTPRFCPTHDEPEYKMDEPFVNLKDRIKFLQADQGERFEEEFEELKGVDQRQNGVSGMFKTARAHPDLNRFKSILANEPTRFKLSSGDYINANVCDGKKFDVPHTFIATQAPMNSTENTFWDMVWESGSSILVVFQDMVNTPVWGSSGKNTPNWDVSSTKTENKNDAFGNMFRQRTVHCYWPPKGKKIRRGSGYKLDIFGMSESKEKDGVIIRTMKVVSSDSNASRVIKMFHYVNWPDMSVPSHPREFLRFVEMVYAESEKDSKCPIILHCVAGVGRTGTFATIFILMRQMREFVEKVERQQNAGFGESEEFLKEGKNNDGVFEFNIFEVVRELKKTRKGMVQRKEQYEFIYLVLLEKAKRLQLHDQRKVKWS